MSRASGDALWSSIAPDANLADGVLVHAASAPDRPALTDGRRTIAYGPLARTIVRVGAGLRREGLGPGDRVALAATDALSATLGLFGGTLAGLVVVPIAPDLPAEERALLIRDLSIAGTLCGPGDEDGLSIPAMAARGDGAAVPDVRVDGGDRPATVMLSSGTTGRPKAIALSHRRQTWFLRALACALGTAASDRYMPIVGPSFAFGRNPMLRLLDAGGTVVDAGPMPPTVAMLAGRVRQAGITELVVTPSHIHAMLADWTGPGIAFPDVRRLIVSTAFLHHADRMAVIDRLCPRLFLGLGMNEVGYVTIADADTLRLAPDTVGRALPGIEIGIVDDDGNALPTGEIGALRVRGPNVGDGYIDDPEASRRGFRAGWFHSGDLAWRDDAGHLFLAGRADDRINRGGVKIYPVEIERVLRAHPAVADAAAVGLPWHRTGELPVAAVVLSAPVRNDALIEWCRARLGTAKAPVRIWALERLPRNAMGKVPPAELREILLACASAETR